MSSQLESNHRSDHDTQHQRRLERYLEEVSKPLPKAEREEWRTEASQHLEAMITAYEELGHSRPEAITLALQRFGAAATLGSHLSKEANKNDRWSTLRGDFVSFILPMTFCFIGLGVVSLIYSVTGYEKLHEGLMVAGRTLQFAAPVLSGAWMGYRRGYQISPGLSLQRMLVAIVCAVPYCLMYLMMFVELGDYGWVLSMPKTLVLLMLWLPLALVSAITARMITNQCTTVQSRT